MHGELAPGASSHIHFSFYGHSDITADVVAACKVDGGPTYELQLCGEASKMHYRFSQKTVDFGAILYDQVHSTEIVLHNRGKVSFEFSTVNVEEEAGSLPMGGIAVSPSRGCILAQDSLTFVVTFLPGIPQRFNKSFQIQVAHFETDVITLVGEAVYPQMTLNLLRDASKVPEDIQQQARANLDLPLPAEGEHGFVDGSRSRQALVDVEVDRLLVKEFAAENADKLFNTQGKTKPR